MYRLEYLPAARDDMVEIVQYISQTLKNPAAARRLAAALIEAGDNIMEFPYANPIYMSIRPLKQDYRKLLVQNYAMFYWIDEQSKVITIARVVYARRNCQRLLE